MDQGPSAWVPVSPFCPGEDEWGGQGGILPPGEDWDSPTWQVLGLEPCIFLSDDCLQGGRMASLHNVVVDCRSG